MRCLRCAYLMVFVALVILALGFFGSADAAGPGATDLTWTDNATNETGYRVERSEALCAPAPTTWGEIADLPANAATYRDSGTALGKGYCYRVRAYNYAHTGDTVPQFSGYSNLAGVDYPFPVPADPSGATAR